MVLPIAAATWANVRATAERLTDSRLCALFIRAQYQSMPADWCRERFNRSYPPVSMVFGNGSWERYQKYMNEGTI